MNDAAMSSQIKSDRRDHPLTLEMVAIGAVFLAALALSLSRVDTTDTPIHLATAREAFATGHWPIRNTFSYTYPDYPLYQQYPIYQTLLYLVYAVGGWQGLSILLCGMWLIILLLLIRWSGGFRLAAKLNVAWLLAVLGLRQRMILRPDVLTILLFVCLLLMVDTYRQRKIWVAAGFVVVQWLMANSHQLYPLGLAVQGALLTHVLLTTWMGDRWGISKEDGRLPLWPLAIALAASLVACLATPIGLEIIQASAHTANTLFYYRKYTDELVPFYTKTPVLVIVVLATGLAAVGFWKARKNWQLFDLLLWLIAAGVVSAAIRGVALYTAVCVGLYARIWVRARSSRPGVATPPLGRTDSRKMIGRVAAASLTLGVSFLVCYTLWVKPPRGLVGGIQPGIGMALGVWPSKTIEFLKRYPPPGRMLNIPWYTGNALIWGLFPQQRVFVDPRFETYPRSFLLESIHAESDDALLAKQISQYQPGWIVAGMWRRDIRERMANLIRVGGWVLVQVDTEFMVLVRNSAENAAYVASHRLDPGQISPQDYLDEKSYPDLLALQQIQVASFFRDLGWSENSRELILKAEPLSDRFGTVRDALTEFRKSYP
jgi:hypothetical protein